MVEQALDAAELLAGEGVDVGVVNCRFIRPMDEECLIEAVREGNVVITVEESSLIGGFGDGVLDLLNRRNLLKDKTLVSLGLPDRFVEHGSVAELLHELKLDAQGLAATASQLISAKRIPEKKPKTLSSAGEKDPARQHDAELKLKEI
jgi:1-deoxy-D-xylulose-5-phosphate synthase